MYQTVRQNNGYSKDAHVLNLGILNISGYAAIKN